MEHLKDDYGAFDEIRIRCSVSTHNNCCVWSYDAFFDKHGYEYDDFLKFPEQHGWTVNPDTYHLQLSETQSPGTNYVQENAEEFIQSWLFFCLITCIVRTEKPLLKFMNLISEPVVQAENTAVTYLCTQKLKPALSTWHEWAKKNRQQSKLRLIQSDLILELGRQVVRANLAEEATRKLDVSPETSLAVMILGETLSAAKLEIMESTGAKVRGWHEDDYEGWGDSEFVSTLIRELRFCPHIAKVLKVQMGSNATLMLAATKHYPGERNHGLACENALNCVHISAQSTGSSVYRPQCVTDLYGEPLCELCQRGECSMVGPDMSLVYDILRNADSNDDGSQFPLFRIRRLSPTKMDVAVEKWSHADQMPDFATISHVWSQGLGNEDRNEIHQCQLSRISGILESLQPQMGTTGPVAGPLFWLDTFAVPVKPKDPVDLQPRLPIPSDWKDLKKRSIRQILHVFRCSTHSVVIDKDLYGSEADNSSMKVAMKLLTSSWMRRLWTLQEAFLSKKLSIAFQSHQSGAHQQASGFPSWDFEQLMEHLAMENNGVESDTSGLSMSGTLIRQLRENLMVSEREFKNRPGNPVGTKGSTLIASAWRSVRWRSISRQEDETLALATLLNLDCRDAGTSKSNIMENIVPGSPEARQRRQEMMKEFWQLVDQHWEGSIPCGMIFLPPPRLSIPGFGWSPETWMTGKVEDYPYPLSRMEFPTQLRREGLLVRYPGIILHSSDLASRLAKLCTDSFDFPVDRELCEAYSVTAIEEPRVDFVLIGNHHAGNQTSPNRFSLILSRPRPKYRNEVALLVEIYASPWRRKEGEAPHEVYQCRIITRVWVRRAKVQKLSSSGVIGELTEEDQHWCVDDYQL